MYIIVNKRNNWAMQIKAMLCTSGFSFIWEQQAVSNKKQFSVVLKLYVRICICSNVLVK